MESWQRDISEQSVAELIHQGIISKEILQHHTLEEITSVLNENLKESEVAFCDALGCVDNLREFINSPEHILGSLRTKHGEVAEHIEVEIRNARNILNRLSPTAVIDKDVIGRTSPVDYIIDGVDVQSKFINSARGSLDAVIEHMRTYPTYSDNAIYHIPKEQYEIITRVANGEKSIEGLTMRSIMALRSKITEIEQSSGRSFSDLVRPSISEYKDVQLGKVSVTIDGYEKEITDFHKQEVKNLRQETAEKREEASHITDASLAEALKYTAIAAAISASLASGLKIFTKVKEGKDITSFTLDDWKEVGYDFVKGGATGGISGLGIYTMTKCIGMSAPFAGAITSLAINVCTLQQSMRNGEISEDEFAERLNCIAVETTLTGIGAFIGQALIPIPALGAILGTISMKTAISVIQYISSDYDKKLIAKLESEYNSRKEHLNIALQQKIDEINNYFNSLGGFIECALSSDAACRLWGSIELCRYLGVSDNQIIRNETELDNFIYN